MTYLKNQVKDIVKRSLEYHINELPEDKINPTLYLIYFEGGSKL